MLTVYAADIRLFARFENEGMQLLTPLRREKALKYRKSEDKLLCMCAGLMLRHQLQITSDEDLRYNARGKPECVSGMQFSISHSGNYAFLATHAVPVGIDGERIRCRKSNVQKRVLTHDEQQYVGDSDDRFFALWTRKEAVLKALGTGLYLAPHSFSVLHNAVELEGQRFQFSTQRFMDDYIVSVACAEPLDFKTDFFLPEYIF